MHYKVTHHALLYHFAILDIFLTTGKMPTGPSLSEEHKATIDKLKKKKKSIRYIANFIGRSTWLVRKYLHDPDSTIRKKRTKFACKITPYDRRHIIRLAQTGKYSAQDIQNHLKLPVTLRTIQLVLKQSKKIKYKKMIHAPKMNENHKKKRLEFAETYVGKPAIWKKTFFTDEKNLTWMDLMGLLTIGKTFVSLKKYFLQGNREVKV